MNTVWIVLPILLVLMFQLGLELDRNSFAALLHRPKGVVAGLLGQLVALPLIAFGVGVLFRLEPVLFMGLMLVACSPGGSSSNVFTMLARGDVALSVTLTALSSLITLVTIPLLMEGVARFVALQSDTAIELPVGRLLLQNILLLLLPMLCGALFRRRFPARAQRLHALLGRVAFPALMLLAALFFVQYARTILEMGAGRLLADGFGLDRTGRRTVVIEVGMQNAAQAIAVASSPLIFNNERMAIPAIVYALVMNVVLLLYLRVLQRGDRLRAGAGR